MLKRSLIVSLLLAASFLGGASTAQAADARVRVYNHSSYNILHIYVSPTYRSNYGNTDLLGRYTIDSGYNVLINFDVDDAEDECILDIKVEGTRNSKWTKRMNVCRETGWHLYD